MCGYELRGRMLRVVFFLLLQFWNKTNKLHWSVHNENCLHTTIGICVIQQNVSFFVAASDLIYRYLHKQSE